MTRNDGIAKLIATVVIAAWVYRRYS